MPDLFTIVINVDAKGLLPGGTGPWSRLHLGHTPGVSYVGMDSTVSHDSNDELSSKLKLAVLGVVPGALAGEKGRIIQYPFQFFRITHNLKFSIQILLNLGTGTHIAPTYARCESRACVRAITCPSAAWWWP